MTSSLEARLAALEAREAIRKLKHRYFWACDTKQPARVRECFADGPVHIDYAHIGVFEDADSLVALFTEMACHDHVVEMHHGQNPQITLLGPDEARGAWGLYYHLINTRDNTLTQLGGLYDDTYARHDGRWVMTSTVFQPASAQIHRIADTDAVLHSVYAGRRPPVPAQENTP